MLALAAAAGGGRVLELGVGTGRLAIALAAQGVGVDGIEGSARMVALLGSRPGGGAVGVFESDLAGFSLPRRDPSRFDGQGSWPRATSRTQHVGSKARPRCSVPGGEAGAAAQAEGAGAGAGAE